MIRIIFFLGVGFFPICFGIFPIKAQTFLPQTFLPGSDGIPLMISLTPLEDSLIQFEDAQGRLTAFSTKGPVTSQALYDYYDSALSNLGWEKHALGLYQHQADQLQIFFEAGTHQGENLIKFELILTTP